MACAYDVFTTVLVCKAPLAFGLEGLHAAHPLLTISDWKVKNGLNLKINKHKHTHTVTHSLSLCLSVSLSLSLSLSLSRSLYLSLCSSLSCCLSVLVSLHFFSFFTSPIIQPSPFPVRSGPHTPDQYGVALFLFSPNFFKEIKQLTVNQNVCKFICLTNITMPFP